VIRYQLTRPNYRVARAETPSVSFTSLHLRLTDTEQGRRRDSTATKWDGPECGHVKLL